MNVAKILDGKATAAALRADISAHVKKLAGEGKKAPGLAVVLVGDDPASMVYVGQKEKACLEVGFRSHLHHLPASTDTDTLIGLLGRMNEDPDVHGILVQLPIPAYIDWTEAVRAIRAEKDVDGTHPLNLGKLVMGLQNSRALYSQGNNAPVQGIRDHHSREKGGCSWEEQYRRETDGTTPYGGRCHGNGMSQQDH